MVSKKEGSILRYFSSLLLLIMLFTLYSCSNSTNPVGGGGNPVTYTVTSSFSRNINKSIPTIDTVSVTNSGTTSFLKFALDTAIAIDGNQKLDVVLVHNNIRDTIIKQFTNPSVPSYSFNGCVCSDSSEFILSPGLTNYSGEYKPYSPLSVFNGEELSGLWYLVFSYPAISKTGVIKSWSITVTYKTDTPPEIIPLKVGNQWVYSTSNFINDTLNIIGTSTISNKLVYNWQWNFWKATNLISYNRNESDGFWNFGFSTSSGSPHLQIKFPISLNEVYIANNWVSTYDTMKCVSTDTIYNGYSGCYAYYDRPSDTTFVNYSVLPNVFSPGFNNVAGVKNENYTFIKPGLGIVGQEFFKNGTQVFYRRLASYFQN